MDNRIELQNISESQRAMLKCRLKQLFECKYQSADFCNEEDFLNAIDADFIQARSWFRNVNDYSLDCKFIKMLEILEKTENYLFEDMNIVIAPEEAKALGLDEKVQDFEHKIIVSGAKLFSKLQDLSLESLSSLSSNIQNQIFENVNAPIEMVKNSTITYTESATAANMFDEKVPDSTEGLEEMLRQPNRTRARVFFNGADGKMVDAPLDAEAIILDSINTLDKNKKQQK